MTDSSNKLQTNGHSNVREKFLTECGFPLDQFQIDALDAIDANKSVLVAAPTGSGKTLVAEYAVAVALSEGKKVFYTTPLKALSNQKFHDLTRIHGSNNVGLLTGDNVINGDAPCVVMTTEVLRNMIYEQSPALERLAFVVLDEVHYMQNAYRGPVWEEVIIHASQEVRLVCLSATVSNAEELAEWITAVRGATVAIIEETRPVELNQHYLISVRGKKRLSMVDMFTKAGRPNPEGNNYDLQRNRFSHKDSVKRPFSTPLRAEVIETLAGENMLPAVYFIFSRNACDDAVRQCLNENIRLTEPEEREQITEIAENAVEHLSDEDLRALDYTSWLTALQFGIAAHHAGMVPPFKEAVEACFALGLIKVVFATETLALGINMPARTVVIEKLTKFTGERHEFLTPGEYTQLTGRAGRRGIDNVGHAVVLWSPWADFSQISGLASARSFALSSSFRPTYNMAANLVSRYPSNVAHQLLNLSFAQYRADAEVVRLETSLKKLDARIELLKKDASCELGDVAEVIAHNESEVDTAPSPKTLLAISREIKHLQIGDVIVDPENDQLLVIVTTSQRRNNDARLGVLTSGGRRFTLTTHDFEKVPHRVAKIPLPKPYNPKHRDFIKRAAGELHNIEQLAVDGPNVKNKSNPKKSGSRRNSDLHAKLGHKPNSVDFNPKSFAVTKCPDFSFHVHALEGLEKVQRERDRLESQVRARAESLARQFDKVLAILEDFAYVNEWSLTEKGKRLANIYNESDLLVSEILERCVLDRLDVGELAAIVSTLTYESRGPAGSGPKVRLHGRGLELAFESVNDIWMQITNVESNLGLPITRAPDPGFADLARNWAMGHELSEMLDDEDISGGDFVRNIKQLIDLMRQIAVVAPSEVVRKNARECSDNLFRGIVAAASLSSGESANIPGDPPASP